MPDKKFSGFTPITSFTGGEYLAGYYGPNNIRFTIDDFITHINPNSQALSSVLAIGNHTDNIDILSPDAGSTLSIVDGIVRMRYNAHGNYGNFRADDNGSVMDWGDGTAVAAITQSPTDTTYAHNVKNKFTSPLNEFGSTLTIDESANSLFCNNGVVLYFGDNTDGQCFIQGVSNAGGSRQFQIYTQYNVSGIFSGSNIIFQNDNLTGQLALSSTWDDGINPTRNAVIDINSFNESVTADAKTLNIGASLANVINIGNAGATVNLLGTALYEYAANQYVLDKLITLNYGGAVGSGIGVGHEIEENGVITGYVKTVTGRDGWSFKAPANTSNTDLIFTATSARTKTLQDTTSTIAEYGDKLSVFDSTTSAELATVISDETGTGALVFATAPTLSNPVVGTQTAGDNSTKAASTAFVHTEILHFRKNIFLNCTPTGNVTSGTTNTLLQYALIPANTITGNNKKVIIKAESYKAGSAGAGTQRMYLNTVNNLTGSPTLIGTQGTSAVNVFTMVRSLKHKSAGNTIIINPTFSLSSDEAIVSSTTFSTISPDWTVDQYILITGQCVNGADSMSDISLEVEFIQ